MEWAVARFGRPVVVRKLVLWYVWWDNIGIRGTERVNFQVISIKRLSISYHLHNVFFYIYASSNSYFFEEYANWTAIHIEAENSNWQKLIINRPKSINIHAGICAKESTLHYVPAVEVKRGAVSGIFEFMSETFLREWHSELWNNPDALAKLPNIAFMHSNDSYIVRFEFKTC